jgi:predicted dehydrogenase
MTDTSRRQFVAGGLASAAAALNLAVSPRRAAAAPANDAVSIALIGFNGMGGFHLKTLCGRGDVRVAALCDVDERVLNRGAETVAQAGATKPALSGDFRRVLDDKRVDAVVIATPHHWHCPIAIRALAAGKDVYLEKPASHVFHEGRLLVEAAKKSGRIVQHGTQMRSSDVTARAGKVLESGLLGDIKTTKAWNVQRQEPPAPRPDGAAPAGVDYDRWLGPAPKRPFNPNRFHGSWRTFRDYGNGDIGDDGAHDLDLARWALGVTTHPVRITAHGSRVDLPQGVREYPDNMFVAYQYADGKVLLYEDRQWTPYGLHGVDSGNAFYGTKGYMIFSRRGFFQTFLGPKEEPGPASGTRGKVSQPAPEHMANFLTAVRSRRPANATAEIAHLSCALIHLGEIAYRTGRVLDFDPQSETFPGDPQASALLSKEYRAPWSIPETS